MQHLTAIRMLMMAKNHDRRVDLVIRGHPFHIDSIERVIVPSKEAGLAAAAGLEGLETDKQLPPEMHCGDLSGSVTMVIGQLRNDEPTTNEFKNVYGCLLIDTDDVSAIAVRGR